MKHGEKPRWAYLLAVLLALVTANSNAQETEKTDDNNAVKIQLGTKSLRLFGYAQTTFNVKDVEGDRTDEMAIDRVILMAQAQLTRRLGFFLMADVAATDSKKHLHEYYGQYDFMPELKIRIGQFKQPFMLENLIPPTLLGNIQMNEATLYETAIATDPLMGNTVGRDAGIMLTGDLLPNSDGRRRLNYSLGIFNGTGINNKENNAKKDLIGMVNWLPAKGVTLSTSFILGTGRALADDVYSDIKAGDDYSRKRWSIGTEVDLRLLKLRAEMAMGWNRGTPSRGAYAEAWVTLWKGLDLVLDFDYLNKDASLSKEQQSCLPGFTETCNYLCGVQYWIYRSCRISSQLVYKDRRTGPDTKQWVTQFQVAF